MDNTTRKYTDLDLSMLPHPISKDIRKKTGTEAIKTSIKNLIFLNHYEVPFNPDIGGGIRQSLFENIYLTETSIILRNRLVDIIETYEPRATLQDIKIDILPDQHNIGVTVYFIPINKTTPVSVVILLKIDR